MQAVRMLLAALALLGGLASGGEDKDKRRLFNTFFLDGDRVTYVLTFRADRTFEIYTPDGQVARGNYAASSKALGIKYEGGTRHFEFEFDGLDVKLRPSKTDQPQAGSILGTLPPIGADSKAVLVAIQNWQKRGLPTEPNRPANAALTTPAATPHPPDLPAAPPVVPEKKIVASTAPQAVPAAANAPQEIVGTYSWIDAKDRAAILRLREGGTFDYISPDGHRDGGTYLYLNGELNLDSGFWRRHFLVSAAENGLTFTRRETDVPKLGDGLGEMAPAQGSATWTKVNDNLPAQPAQPAAPQPVEPVAPVAPPPTAPVAPLVKTPPPEVAAPSVTPPAVPPKPAEPGPSAAPAENVKPTGVAQLIGTFIHRPNPLVSETWKLQDGGQFEYSDSNGAKVVGTATLDGDRLRLQAGEVVRLFAVSIEKDGALLFTRLPEDAPRILNDLASMSPSVLKSARYDKK